MILDINLRTVIDHLLQIVTTKVLRSITDRATHQNLLYNNYVVIKDLFLDGATRQQLAEALAENYTYSLLSDIANNSNENIIPPLHRRHDFFNRMIRHWFMYPFTTPIGSVIYPSKESESLTLNVINNYLISFSNNEFRGGKVLEINTSR